MDTNSEQDLRINGTGTVSGGNFRSVSISGTGKVTTDTVCRDFRISGSGEIMGNLESESFRINGSAHLGGDVKSQEVKVNGSANFRGNIACHTMQVSGSCDVEKNVDAQFLKISGSTQITGDCNAEKFNAYGAFDIGGLLNADEVTIELYWHKSHAREIGGENIHVTRGSKRHGFLKFIGLFGMNNPRLDTDTIEGDNVYLENTQAKVVRGRNVTIGSGCHIGLVEYQGDYEKHKDAEVAEERKIL